MGLGACAPGFMLTPASQAKQSFVSLFVKSHSQSHVKVSSTLQCVVEFVHGPGQKATTRRISDKQPQHRLVFQVFRKACQDLDAEGAPDSEYSARASTTLPPSFDVAPNSPSPPALLAGRAPPLLSCVSRVFSQHLSWHCLSVLVPLAAAPADQGSDRPLPTRTDFLNWDQSPPDAERNGPPNETDRH